MFEEIKDKKVLITGASSGIGATTARLFASHGTQVGIHYNLSRKAAEELREEIVNLGGKAECFAGDLLEFATGRKLIQDFLTRFEGLDILINNAGAVVGPAHFSEIDEAAWDQTIRLNARAPFFLSREAFAHMKDHGGGKIINISSIAAKYGGSPWTLHYGAAKAALEALTKGLAREGAPHKILVNAIRGGFIDTPAHKKMGRINIQERIAKIPLKRAGQPREIAQLALFLASAAGDYISGEIISVSGGD